MAVGARNLPSRGEVSQRLPEQDLAFEFLYRTFFNRLVGLLTPRVGDRAAAEDLAQDTIIRAAAHLDGFDRTRPPWPWLKVIATRLAANYLVSRRREVLRAEVHDPPSTASDWEHLAVRIEDSTVLNQALSALPIRQRLALTLHHLDDWSARQIAVFFQVTEQAVEQLLFRARRKLRAEYERLVGEATARVRILLAPFVSSLRTRMRLLKEKIRSVMDGSLRIGSVSIPFGDLVAGLVAASVVTVGLVALMADPRSHSGLDHPWTAGRGGPGVSSSDGSTTKNREAIRRLYSVGTSTDALIPGGPRASAEISGEATKKRIRVRVTVRTPGNEESKTSLGLETDAECDYSIVQSMFCEAVGMLPDEIP